jgi:hypothetical protein
LGLRLVVDHEGIDLRAAGIAIDCCASGGEGLITELIRVEKEGEKQQRRDGVDGLLASVRGA